VADDAAVYRINRDTAVVATLDFFAPVVDDPYTYGAIAAANAMSDVYAMGGEVILALNIAAFPKDLPPATVTEILRGAAEKVAEGGAVIAGGHTIWDTEPKFGLSVLGLAHPRRLFTKATLRPNDILYLTKPLGTGVIISAARGGGEPEWLASASRWMSRLNRHAAHLAHEAGVRAATDITGFGLLGHLWEMAERSNVAVELRAAGVPLLTGALESSAAGAHTGGESRNREWVGSHAAIGPSLDPALEALLFDPQTSGGLVLAASPRRARVLEAAFARDDVPLWRIGRALAGQPGITVA
jgi:selenide,water dikinase